MTKKQRNTELAKIRKASAPALAVIDAEIQLHIEDELRVAAQRKRECAPLNGNRCFSLLKK